MPARAPRLRELLGVALVALLGCEIAEVDVVRQGNATIPSDGGAIAMMQLDDLEIELAEIEDTEDIGREDITDARLHRMLLETIDAAQGDLAFADSIEVFAEAPGLGRVRVAHQENFPVGARLVELEVDDVDLADYIAAPQVTLVAIVDGSMPDHDVVVRATAQLVVGVTVRGACDHAT